MLLVWLMLGILFLHLFPSLGCFCPRTFFLSNVLDYIQWVSSYVHTKLRIISRQGCLMLCNWFFLWHLWPWMKHLPPVWWSNFRFMFLKWQLVCKFGIDESSDNICQNDDISVSVSDYNIVVGHEYYVIRTCARAVRPISEPTRICRRALWQ